MVRGLILFKMRILFTILILSLGFPVIAAAQDAPTTDNEALPPPIIVLPAPEPLPAPEFNPDPLELELAPTVDPDVDVADEDVVPETLLPDYSQLSPSAERAVKLEDLFQKLAEKEDEQSANLVAEEILAIWMDSGSASVNLLLRRGSEADARGNSKLARTMYNHAVDLSPEFSEAWARSARLALTQKDYNRALNESLKTLALEPRHFYTLWTLGNVFEALGRPDEALEAYREANALYPELKAVKDRLAALEIEIGGSVL